MNWRTDGIGTVEAIGDRLADIDVAAAPSHALAGTGTVARDMADRAGPALFGRIILRGEPQHRAGGKRRQRKPAVSRKAIASSTAPVPSRVIVPLASPGSRTTRPWKNCRYSRSSSAYSRGWARTQLIWASTWLSSGAGSAAAASEPQHAASATATRTIFFIEAPPRELAAAGIRDGKSRRCPVWTNDRQTQSADARLTARWRHFGARGNQFAVAPSFAAPAIDQEGARVSLADALRQRLEKRYLPTLAIALLALTPYIIASNGAELFGRQVQRDVGMSAGGLSLASALSVAGYAWGALLAGDLIQRFRKRHLFPLCQGLAAIGWAASASAAAPWAYVLGQSCAGLGTGMLLVIALPPTIQQFPASRIALTAVFINVGLFGGVAGGPLVGGAIARIERLAGFCGAGRGGRADGAVLPRGVAGRSAVQSRAGVRLACARAGAGRQRAAVRGYGDAGKRRVRRRGVPGSAGPRAGVLRHALLVEYRRKEPLAPVRKMASTVPVVGTMVAAIGGGVFVTLMRLAIEDSIASSTCRRAAGALFWPQLTGALIAAALLGAAFRTRYLPLLVLGGMATLIAGGALLLTANGGTGAALLAAVGLLGLGAGATVSPGLFLAGMSLPSNILGRIVALIELVRSVGDFLMAPVLMQVARDTSGRAGFELAVSATLVIAVVATAAGLLLYLLGRAGLPRPAMTSSA